MRICKGRYTHENLKIMNFEHGYFHQFGFESSEYGNYSIAIVELEDGKIITPSANQITFLDKKREV